MEFYTIAHHESIASGLPCDCDGCRGEEIESHPSEWPISEETDLERWTVTETAPDDDDETADDHLWNEEEAEFRDWAAGCEAKQHLQRDRLTLRALVERQRDFYRSWQNDAGLLIADTLEELVRLLQITGAASSAEHFARIDALDRDFS